MTDEDSEASCLIEGCITDPITMTPHSLQSTKSSKVLVQSDFHQVKPCR